MEPQSEFVLIYELDGVKHEHVLAERRVVIGRAKDCNLCLPFNAEVSRLHATLSGTVEGWVVEDMSSRLGTFVNDERIAGPRTLHDEDELTIGQVRMTFREKKYGVETVSLDSQESREYLAAAASRDPDAGRSRPSNMPFANSADSEPASQLADRDLSNIYALLDLANFEADVARIHAAAKERLSVLRSAGASGSPADEQGQVDAIARGLAAISTPQK